MIQVEACGFSINLTYCAFDCADRHTDGDGNHSAKRTSRRSASMLGASTFGASTFGASKNNLNLPKTSGDSLQIGWICPACIATTKLEGAHII
jgi:hypothetical protein